MTVLQVLTDFLQLLADALEGLQHARLVDYVLLLTLESLGSPLEGKAFHLDEEMKLREDLHIFLGTEPVTLGIALRLDEFRELICPETHQRRAFAYDFGNFAYCVEILFHNFFCIRSPIRSGMTLMSGSV